jgi:hypothetical protein
MMMIHEEREKKANKLRQNSSALLGLRASCFSSRMFAQKYFKINFAFFNKACELIFNQHFGIFLALSCGDV